MAAMRSSTLARSASCPTSMRADAKCDLTLATPRRRPTLFSILPTQDGQEKPLARRVVLVMVLLMTVAFSRGFVNDCVTTLWKPPGTHHEKSQSRTSSHVFYVKRTP